MRSFSSPSLFERKSNVADRGDNPPETLTTCVDETNERETSGRAGRIPRPGLYFPATRKRHSLRLDSVPYLSHRKIKNTFLQ